ncbi:MAG: hypothetical protein R3B69_00210 [Candidatus Paceibacterota bacterium]
MTWETTQPTRGQVFFSPKTGEVSPFNETLPNKGYARSTNQTPVYSTRHFVLLVGLDQGATYRYRIHAMGNGHDVYGGDYTVTVPGAYVQKTPTTTYAPVAATTQTPATASTPPAPAATPEPATPPTDNTAPGNDSGGAGVGGVIKNAASKVFGFFR